MIKMIGFLFSSFLERSIWKEALKSFLYFFILFIVLLFPSNRLIAYFAGRVIENQYGTLVYEVVLGVTSVLFSLIAAYLFIMFSRDSYFYRLVKAELGGEGVGGSGAINQLKSIIRVIFLLVATIMGIFVSFFLPLLGMALMSFCFALEILSYVFDTEKLGLTASFKFVFNNLLATLILGSFCFFLALIPGLGLVSYPASIRAGALYFKSQKEME